MRPGKKNLITDVPGIRVGNASDDLLKSGVTVVVGDEPMNASVSIMGGAPGTRETDLLAADKIVQQMDALVLAGGSAFGLDAGSGVADGLRMAGRGFKVGTQRVPIVPAAILFDLLNGGNKGWQENPYKALGREALESAGTDFGLGTVGAGTGATTRTLKGGLGSASLVLDNGITVGAIVAVNALGDVVGSSGPEFWAASWEFGDEFGGLGPIGKHNPALEPGMKPGQATTLAIVATDADLTQAQCLRMATAAHDGIGRAVVPAHTPLDGDLVFSVATGARRLEDELVGTIVLGHAAAICVTRAIARGVYFARSALGDPVPTWADRYGHAISRSA
ncbi:P1 family peptidase [Tropicimonas sp.]|uniref:P1 family peptidase n=1 Tax=Tropicimonas sp. TaxID=2067044 RepID=UPI003A89A395